MSFAEILPLAFVMIAGPQIITSFSLATSERWAVSSLAYVAGAALSVTALVTIGYFVGKGVKGGAGSGHKGTADLIIDAVVLALILFLIVHVFLTRHTAKPPKWMSKLQTASPKFAFGLGFVLLGVFLRTSSARSPPVSTSHATTIPGGSAYLSLGLPCYSWRCRRLLSHSWGSMRAL